ncbi:MAG: stage 0 sporulation family protein [Planctomycetota bacterium]
MFRATVRYGRLRHLADVSPETAEVEPPRVRDRCIIRTERGLELGTVLVVRQGGAVPTERRAFLRRAGAEDDAKERANAATEERARLLAREKAAKLGLGITVLGVELLHSGDRLLVHYQAEDRQDLRELARLLQADLGARVEMRQLGARDRARAACGTGVCGRTLCCSTFLRDLEPVTLRMAKVQGFSLAPDATSGACGRLKCCLRYENPLYDEARSFMPRKGMHVETRRAAGEVVAVNVLTRQVTVKTRDEWLVTLYAAEIASAKVTRVEQEPGQENDQKPKDSRWRGITERLNIFRRRPGKVDPDQEKPS